MKIIIPMAGKGTRLRPQTITTPKPLFNIVGQPLLNRLIKSLLEIVDPYFIDEIIFIINHSEKNKIEHHIINVTKHFGISIKFYYQDQPLGTADAIFKAHKSLTGPIIIAFSDTLFYNKEKYLIQNIHADNIIWTKKVTNPYYFGIVKCNSSGYITNFLEKPTKITSNIAIIGIYYFKNSSILKNELKYLLDNKLSNNQEYQFTDVLENMRKKGISFLSKEVYQWMDFGDPEKTIISNSAILYIESKKQKLIHKKSMITNSIIISPSYIEKDVFIENSVIGPYTSIGKFTNIKNSFIQQSIIQDYTILKYINIKKSIIGNYVKFTEKTKQINLGDYSTVQNI
ncbi:sugar phosphate nucleotidyltransferase [Blattabacterium cuenoti]|uniref:sugar phosphate nucleotidyltransferase n=1 Tax=Blattabacterium cuenoti TaxID=1653831 RepID=UPI00163B74E7|nr:sugar phosphate nucleotidyltransferase [Blattabacterium cuenoti]